jgi:membrane fusion protein, multidrug efflux system
MSRLWTILKRGVVAIGSLAALVLILVWFAGGFEEKIDTAPVETPQRRHAGEPTGQVLLLLDDLAETAVGTIAARERTAVSSRITARVEAVHVRAGDPVGRGDVLAVLDSRDLESREAQAREALVGAEAAAQRARADLVRYTDLLDQGVVNQAEFEQVESSARIAEADVARAGRALEETRVALTYAEVQAPISGRVVDRLVEPGDLAAPGQPLLTLYNPEALRLEAAVREGLATRLRVGDPLRVRIETIDLEVVGEIEEIVPQAEAGSRSFLVKVTLPQVEGLYTGMFGRLMIPAGVRERLCLPEAALERLGQLEFVDVVLEGGLVERRLVQTGEHSGERDGTGHIEVLSGLASGDVVLVGD